MYYVSKRMEIAGAHSLTLDYESKCSNLHGHNWIVVVYCCSSTLDKNGMVYDFTKLKKDVHGRFDHHNFNDVLNVNPTAENIAYAIGNIVGDTCYKVSVQESEGNIAIWEKTK